MRHNGIMRTTVNIPDHLIVEAKRLAALRKLPLTVIFEESLRFYLAEQRRQTTEAPTPSLPLGDMGPPLKGIDLDDTSELMEL
jgi:hypothetical protein